MAARQSHRSTLLAASLYVVFCASGARAALINSTWQCGTDNYSKNTCWDPLLAISPYNRGSLEFEVTIPAGSGTVSMDLDVAPCTEVNSFFLGEGRTFKVLAGKCYKVLGQADIYGTIWGNGGNFIAPDANFPQCKAQVWVDSGGYVEIGAPTYCATQLTTNHELLMADGAGSLLDLSAMMELNDAFTNSSNSVAEHSIVAEDGGVIDLSGLKKITGPRGNENLVVQVKSGGSILWDSLTTITDADQQGRVLFHLDGGTTIDLPSLTSTNSTYFSATNGAKVSASNSPFSFSFAEYGANSGLLSCSGADSLLNLSAMTELNDAFTNSSNSVAEHSIVAEDGGVIDLSGLKKITGPRGNENLTIRVKSGARIDMSSLQTLAGSTGKVSFSEDKGGTLLVGNVNAQIPIVIGLNDPNDLLIGSRDLSLGTTITVSNPGNGCLTLHGDFTYAHRDETKAAFGHSYVFVSGEGPQELEAGGLDFDVFWQELANDNFGFGQMVVGAPNEPSVVFLVDRVDNGNRGGLTGYEEALYLFGKDDQDGLRLLDGSTLYMGGLAVYAALDGQMTDLRTLFGAQDMTIRFDEGWLCLGKPDVNDPKNRIKNGGFETGINPPGIEPPVQTLLDGSTGIDYWTVGVDTLDWCHESHYADGGPGQRYADLSSDTGVASASQVISTVPGELYHVWFDMTASPLGDAGERALLVSAAGASEEFPCVAAAEPDWRTKTWRFTATDTLTTLTFANAGEPNLPSGVAIDNVIVFGRDGERKLTLGVSTGGSVGVASESIGAVAVTGPGEATFTFEPEAAELVHLSAQPQVDPNYVFSGWTGLELCDSNEGRAEIGVRTDKSISLKANFSNLDVTITEVDDSNCPVMEAAVMVTDLVDGSIVTGLNELNFTVYEDRTPIEQNLVTVLQGTSFISISVSLCLDFSASMDDKAPSDPCTPLEAMQSAAKTFLDAMDNSGDRVEIIKFAEDVETAQAFTDVNEYNRVTLKTVMDDPTSLYRGATSLYDAICRAIADTTVEPGSRAVIVMTDGGDNASDVCDPNKVIKRGQDGDIPVFIIGLGNQMNRLMPGSDTETVGACLERIATSTEGRYYYAPVPSDLTDIYLKISRALSEQYLVIYPTAGCTSGSGGASQAHEVTVEVNVGDLSGRDVWCLRACGCN